jgi:hypothetical protein
MAKAHIAFGKSMYGRFSIKIAHFVPIRNKHGNHRQFLFVIGGFLKIFSSETTLPNEPKLVFIEDLP